MFDFTALNLCCVAPVSEETQQAGEKQWPLRKWSWVERAEWRRIYKGTVLSAVCQIRSHHSCQWRNYELCLGNKYSSWKRNDKDIVTLQGYQRDSWTTQFEPEGKLFKWRPMNYAKPEIHFLIPLWVPDDCAWAQIPDLMVFSISSLFFLRSVLFV